MKYHLIILFSMLALSTQAQEEINDNFESAFNACVTMAKAAAEKDSAALRISAQELKRAKVGTFSSLRCQDDSVESVNGHLVFDDAFADSLANGNDSVYQQADEFRRGRTSRGQSSSGSILTKTCFVKAGKSTRYTFPSRGHQELAVVAETGGLVTMKIHVTNRSGFDKRFDDTKNVKKGMPRRRASFDLPQERLNTVNLEVINCSNKDISFVVISN